VAWRPRAGRLIVKLGVVVEVEELAVSSGPRCAAFGAFSMRFNVTKHNECWQFDLSMGSDGFLTLGGFNRIKRHPKP
jgi:hypothetical protein